ncbi:TPA: MFS transporter [Bacillus cereus]
MKQKVLIENKKNKMTPYWIRLVIVFFLGWIFIYGNRAILTPVIGEIKSDYSLNNAEIGLMNSLFFLAYTIVQIPSGYLGDMYSKKWVLVPGFLISGIFLAVTGVSEGYLLLISAWMISGIGQGTFYGPQFALSSESIPNKYRTIGSAIINSGGAIGLSLGFIFSSYFTLSLGFSWRITFFIFALLTIIVSIIMLFTIKNDSKNENLIKRKIDIEEKKFSSSIKLLLMNRNLIVSYIVAFCSLYGFSVMVTWLPYYLQTEQGIEGSIAGYLSSIIALLALPGSILFSWINDRFQKHVKIMKFMLIFSSIFTFLIGFTNSTVWIIVGLVLYGFMGKIAMDPIIVAFVANNAPQNLYSTTFGLYNFIGMSSSVLAPYITGVLSIYTGSMKAGFYLASVFLLIGYFSLILIKEKDANIQ